MSIVDLRPIVAADLATEIARSGRSYKEIACASGVSRRLVQAIHTRGVWPRELGHGSFQVARIAIGLLKLASDKPETNVVHIGSTDIPVAVRLLRPGETHQEVTDLLAETSRRLEEIEAMEPPQATDILSNPEEHQNLIDLVLALGDGDVATAAERLSEVIDERVREAMFAAEGVD
ncbi:hypothetical protein IHQ68_04460 [Chelatococcus sambhunathii]|uniref:Uncharacterized protein n=1 Tax=Chelatococcus sambhunathii TaxID=363953 RepID=A0ABU1DCV2_9HYPH|nr:hypothetical protein [Chelatococcus sambhunathii]MDR4305878.1 hypothetical protein [Chelatococcus sambhunathii]